MLVINYTWLQYPDRGTPSTWNISSIEFVFLVINKLSDFQIIQLCIVFTKQCNCYLYHLIIGQNFSLDICYTSLHHLLDKNTTKRLCNWDNIKSFVSILIFIIIKTLVGDRFWGVNCIYLTWFIYLLIMDTEKIIRFYLFHKCILQQSIQVQLDLSPALSQRYTFGHQNCPQTLPEIG